jgi:hypothetical protein
VFRFIFAADENSALVFFVKRRSPRNTCTLLENRYPRSDEFSETGKVGDLNSFPHHWKRRTKTHKDTSPNCITVER